jgi:anti-sigma B factor antagonist
MDIKTYREESKLTVELIGRLDTLTSPEVEKKISQELEGINELVFDLKGLDYISSSGIRVLLGAQKAMDASHGTMKVAGPGESIMDVLVVTGLDSVFNII